MVTREIGDPRTCDHCGFLCTECQDYWCPRCLRLNERLYRREHADPEKAWGMTLAEIEAEYAAAGIPMTPIHIPRGELEWYRNTYRQRRALREGHPT